MSHQKRKILPKWKVGDHVDHDQLGECTITHTSLSTIDFDDSEGGTHCILMESAHRHLGGPKKECRKKKKVKSFDPIQDIHDGVDELVQDDELDEDYIKKQLVTIAWYALNRINEMENPHAKRIMKPGDGEEEEDWEPVEEEDHEYDSEE